MTSSADPKWHLPSPAHVQDCIRRWRDLDLRHASHDEIAGSLVELRDRIGSVLVQSKTFRFPNLWRVRRGGRSFDNVGDFWCPPAERAPQGRCNLPGQAGRSSRRLRAHIESGRLESLAGWLRRELCSG